MIHMMDKLCCIDPKDFVMIKVDMISLRKPYPELFPLSKDVGDWKIEKGSNILAHRTNGFYNHRDNGFSPRGSITERKKNYGQFNLISGSAGTGKTTGFIEKFSIDETLGNLLMCFPNNELRASFKKKYPNITCMTYHMAFNIGCYTDVLKYYSNVVIDEASMIGATHIDTIIKKAKEFKVNL